MLVGFFWFSASFSFSISLTKTSTSLASKIFAKRGEKSVIIVKKTKGRDLQTLMPEPFSMTATSIFLAPDCTTYYICGFFEREKERKRKRTRREPTSRRDLTASLMVSRVLRFSV